MELTEFLAKNNIALDKDLIDFCQEGIEMMRESIDPVHSEKHIFRILDILDRFLKENGRIGKGDVDFEVLLTSICWHDAWKSKRFPGYWLKGLYQAFWEGMGSRRVFAREAKEAGLEKEIIKPVRYAIRKHSRFQLFKPKTLEAKILKDADNLEFWSLERIKEAAQKVEKNNWISPALIKTARFYLRLLGLINRKSSLSFDWSRSEAEKMKQNYREELKKLIDDYEQRYLKK